MEFPHLILRNYINCFKKQLLGLIIEDFIYLFHFSQSPIYQ